MTFSTLLKDYIPKRPLIRKLNDTFCIHHPCYKYQYFVALSGHHAPSWKCNFEKTCFSPKNDICMRCTPLDWTFFGMKVEDIPSSLYTCTTLLATFKDTALFFVCKRTMSEMKSCISSILKVWKKALYYRIRTLWIFNSYVLIYIFKWICEGTWCM